MHINIKNYLEEYNYISDNLKYILAHENNGCLAVLLKTTI